MPLTNTAVKNSKPKAKQYRLSDSQNLYLLVKPTGSKLWRLDYALHGKRKTMALGSYPVTTLKIARTKRDEAKALIEEGIDPVQHRKCTQANRSKAAENTFEALSMEWLAKQEQAWTPGHTRTVVSRLERDLLPWLGNRPITEITPPEILQVLRRIEQKYTCNLPEPQIESQQYLALCQTSMRLRLV